MTGPDTAPTAAGTAEGTATAQADPQADPQDRPRAGTDPAACARLLSAVARKRARHPLEPDLIEALVADFVAGRVPDYQMAAWLATVACRGMDPVETAALTRAYVAGGERLDLGGADRPVVDKHSTGGVGDKVSLVVVPVVAACGVAVAKVSGRGLGHAGGTLDKLESVRGLRLDLDAAAVRAVLGEAGMVITGQSADLVPGDRATYRLRDVTGTVGCVPLIAASIMSKKVAVGADGLVLDVKTGAGALLPERHRAVRLAETMLGLAHTFGLRCRAVLTDMSQPLGHAVGNALEVREALAVLRGEHVPGLSEVCAVLARLMLQCADPHLPGEAADARVCRALSSGAAHETFARWVRTQGGDARQVERPELLPSAPHREVVHAAGSGWVGAVDPRAVGTAALLVGAGRLVQGEPVDHAAGVVVHRRVGDPVRAGEPLAEVHHRGHRAAGEAARLVGEAFGIGPHRRPEQPVVHQIL